MAVSTVPETKPLKGIDLPEDIASKVKRGTDMARKDSTIRRQCVKFFQNEPYWYIKSNGQLGVLPTALDAVDKANYRIRKKMNLIPSMVQRKVSAATQRIPQYQVDPSTADQDNRAAARLAEQVLTYGYDQWRMRRLAVKTVTNALVQREGFVMPYFDQNVGPYHKTDKGYEGQGDIRFLTLNRSEVGWEPGVDFEDSPWYVIVRAQLTEDVKKIPGFLGGDPPKNAMLADLPEGKKSGEMTEVTMFLERPCPDYPQGRMCYIADKKIIADARKADPEAEYWWEDYPYKDAKDNAIDEPCIHRLSYTVDPEGDDKGLVENLIDPQLTVLDCWNKILELKNRALMLQAFAPKGSGLPPRDDTPGATYFYNPIGGLKPEWEPAPDPQYLAQLNEIKESAKLEMRAIAGDIDIQPEPDLAAKTLNAAIEQAMAQWQVFLGDIAEWHSRVGRHCLTLVARHYDRERVIRIRGVYGWEPDKTFRGSDLHSQMNVRVSPASIESKTRTQSMQEAQVIAQTFPGALQPEQFVSVFNGDHQDNLFKSYDLHKARAWDLVQRLRANPDEVFNAPPRMDLEIGDPMMGYMVPAWMPRPQDNLVIWKEVIGTYMITPDFEEQREDVKRAFDLIWKGLETYEQIKLMKMQQQEMDAAAMQGSANAAKDQGPIEGPAVDGGLQTPEQAAPAAGTPE